MEYESIAFIGGGNMTRAIVGGLLEGGYSAGRISIAEPSSEQQKSLSKELPGVYITADNENAITRASNVVLAVKPQIIAKVCTQIAAVVQEVRPLIISIAAGPRIADIDSWLGEGNAIARVMPNQPALLGKGVSGIFANQKASAGQLETARTIMSAVGPVITVENEADIDAVTAVSGSGPAYFYLLIDMLAKTGVRLGLNEDAALQLAVETALGAATLAQSAGDSMDELIARVRSPGGTTAAALDSLETQGVRDIFTAAITEARDRAIELADQAHETAKD